MIVQLTGTRLSVTPSVAVLDVGVGYELGISLQQLLRCRRGGRYRFNCMVVREDSMELFGFCFAGESVRSLIVCAQFLDGPKLALSVLSTFTHSNLR